MPDFLFAYHGGTTPQDPEEIERVMAAWGAWFESMGNAVVNPGNPVGKSFTITRDAVIDDGGANPISGYSVVHASTKDEAIDLAQGCPMVRDGSGSIEVAEIQEM